MKIALRQEESENRLSTSHVIDRRIARNSASYPQVTRPCDAPVGKERNTISLPMPFA